MAHHLDDHSLSSWVTNTHPPELTLEDLTVSEQLTQLQRVERYVTSPIALQRLVHVKMFGQLAQQEGLDTTRTVILPLLILVLADDKVVVRQVVPEQIVLISEFVVTQGDEGYSVFVDSLMPCLARMLYDNREDVRQSASEAFVRASKLVRTADIGRYVLTVLLRLAHDDEREMHRMSAAWLLNELSPCLGTDISLQYLVPEVLSMAEDPEVRVRRQVVWNLKKIFSFLQAPDRLVNCFIALTKDESFRVRKACTEVFADISVAMSEEKRADILLKAYTKLLQDSSKKVRNAALKHLALFLVTLDSTQIPAQLVTDFISMAQDDDLRRQCAFDFPAVLFTIGSARWSEVRDGYLSLASSRLLTIRRTLAHSFHEVTKILGASLVEDELLGVFEGYLQDHDELISFGVISHLADILGSMSLNWRQSYLYILKELLDKANEYNWRLREHVAAQLRGLAPLLESRDVSATLAPIAAEMIKDKVASVRAQAFLAIPACILALTDDAVKAPFVEEYLAFATGTVQEKQIFINICGDMIKTDFPDALVLSSFLSKMTCIVTDPLPAARVALANYIRTNSWTHDHAQFQPIISLLKEDEAVKRSLAMI